MVGQRTDGDAGADPAADGERSATAVGTPADGGRPQPGVEAPVGRVRRLSPAEVAAYDLVPAAVARRAVLVRVPVLPPGAQGMTSGRFVFLRRPEPTDGSSTLIAHELVHVRQFAERGRIRFALGYFSAYFANLARLRRHRQAYLAIPYEQEAYRMSREWKAARALKP